ncbi:MAG TPA: HWE histidine kinase domain-containing protein [Rhizomicrobium sp.]|jgi:two-component sensor histidine kinase|nr:HWE histidine kinase domain-containing protein [Rhizomicrobium sp.]
MNVIQVKSPKPRSTPDFLAGGGEMGAAIRAFNWAATPLGPPESWPRTLRTCLRIMLASRQPMWVWWGPELINFYNDAYLPIIGGKHPAALGQPAHQVWSEIWDQIKDRIHAAQAGESSYSEAEMLIMHRHGYPEETYYTFSFSPVPEEDGNIGGLVCASTDDTDRVIGARRLALLRELASRTWDADTVDEVYSLASRALATDPRDMPFALIYRFEEDGARATLRGTTGIAAGQAAAPDVITLEGNTPWPVSEVMRGGSRRQVTRLAEKFGPLPKGPWPDAPDEALLLPLVTSADTAPRGVLVLAVNPYRRHGDESFENFAALVARQIASAIVNIESFEAERERAKSADSLAMEIEHRRRIERHQNLLLDELNHRVKNTLATVQAMAIQTMKGVDLCARDAFLARLFALSSQHDLLTLDNWEGASLEGVVRRALRPWREDEHVRFQVTGPAVHLNPKRALALGMVFHEMATNAARYGALSNATGAVDVRWAILPDGKALKFTWEERRGPPVTPPQRRGFGLRLIEHGMEREISGKVTLDFRPEGLVCTWDMKLT